jgi:hypothetical protein
VLFVLFVIQPELIEGGDDGMPKVINPPLADPTHKEYLQGEATKLTFTDAGQNWKYEKSNYMRNHIKQGHRGVPAQPQRPIRSAKKKAKQRT